MRVYINHETIRDDVFSSPYNRKLVSWGNMAATGSMQKGEEEWRAVLSPEQFRILSSHFTSG